jgi:hypothetical protein
VDSVHRSEFQIAENTVVSETVTVFCTVVRTLQILRDSLVEVHRLLGVEMQSKQPSHPCCLLQLWRWRQYLPPKFWRILSTSHATSSVAPWKLGVRWMVCLLLQMKHHLSRITVGWENLPLPCIVFPSGSELVIQVTPFRCPSNRILLTSSATRKLLNLVRSFDELNGLRSNCQPSPGESKLSQSRRCYLHA